MPVIKKLYAGVDVGFRGMGVVLAEITKHRHIKPLKWRTVETDTNGKFKYVIERDCANCLELFNGVSGFFHEYAILPEKVFLELPHGGSKSLRAARCMSLATGVIVGWLGCNNLMPIIVTPKEVKNVYNVSSKEDIMEHVRKEQPDIAWPDVSKEFEHIADAYCAIKVGLSKE